MENHAAGENLATTGEVAAFLNIPEKTLAEWRSQSRGPRFSKIGRYVRYRWADIHAWVDEQTSDMQILRNGKEA